MATVAPRNKGASEQLPAICRVGFREFASRRLDGQSKVVKPPLLQPP